jgi:predicted ArsR family transcriptional regulator
VESQRAGLEAVSSLDDPVRGRLYEYVSGCAGPVSRDQAAAATGIGRGLAAYHLDKLVGLGLLTAAYRRPDGRTGRGAGRPAKVYSRSGREFAVTVPPREYELAARLLTRAVDADDTGTSRAALPDVARTHGAELGRRHRERRQAGTGERQAMESALREHGFEPWHDQAGTIWLRNCPFHRLAAEHRDLTCGMNLALIEGITAGLGAAGLCPALDPGPGRCCVVIATRQTAEHTTAGRTTPEHTTAEHTTAERAIADRATAGRAAAEREGPS